jgi:pimeloyl-ACP methyl ester carboxylesterase
MPYLSTRDGQDIYYKDWGTGRSIVLLHGWPLSSDMWDAQAMALAENGFRAIAYDRRGFGRSAQPFDGYDYDSLADDLAAVLEQTDAGDDVTLVGFSMGGGEVARYMSRHGGRGVRSVALVASIVPYMLKTGDNPNGVPQSAFDEIAAGIKKDRADYFRNTFFLSFFGTSWLSHPVSDALLDNVTRVALQAGLKATLACAQSFAHTDFRPDLAAFRVPTLIIHGTQDKTVPIDTSARPAHAGIPGSMLTEYEGAPHGLSETDGQKLTHDLLAFAAR